MSIYIPSACYQHYSSIIYSFTREKMRLGEHSALGYTCTGMGVASNVHHLTVKIFQQMGPSRVGSCSHFPQANLL